MLRNYRQDGPKAIQEYLRSIAIDMSFSGVRKLLKGMSFKRRRKIQTKFISKKNKPLWLAWVKNTNILRQTNGGSGCFLTKPESISGAQMTVVSCSLIRRNLVEGDGGSVLFRGCITENGPGYGTTVMDGTVNSIVYVDILQSFLLDPLEYYDMNRNVVRFQQGNATPHTS